MLLSAINTVLSKHNLRKMHEVTDDVLLEKLYGLYVNGNVDDLYDNVTYLFHCGIYFYIIFYSFLFYNI